MCTIAPGTLVLIQNPQGQSVWSCFPEIPELPVPPSTKSTWLNLYYPSSISISTFIGRFASTGKFVDFTIQYIGVNDSTNCTIELTSEGLNPITYSTLLIGTGFVELVVRPIILSPDDGSMRIWDLQVNSFNGTISIIGIKITELNQ